MSKGSAQRTTDYKQYNQHYNHVNMLKPDEEWALNYMSYDAENDIWTGFAEDQSTAICWGFNQRQCYEKLLKHKPGCPDDSY